ncbi:hypothetical protein B7494_g40 [Chlorociboria aeruginascens]|nr:hypothetical protein B7494_g40 [Chlorociboria aeruginascens]
MPSFFSRLKGGRDGASKSKKKGAQQAANNDLPPKPIWEDAWLRTSVEPEEVHEMLRGCTAELKSRALDIPFLLLPFRPTSDPSAARTFVRHFFERRLHGEALAQELRLTEPMVLCSVLKWCWGRLPGGVVSWEAYELFRVGETDSNMARDAFVTFIPLSVDSDARTSIIFDFFDLLAAIAAHGKSNGLGGRKLSRLAGWWAFEHKDEGNGFEGGYKGWAAHLFFAYLRSLSPESVKGLNGISTLPMSLQKLVQETEYPPEKPSLLQSTTTKVVMIVDSVSPTPFALLRRANHFQYRDDDRALQEFAEYDDPIKALTDECRRVLRSISSTNQSQISNSKESTGLPDASWSRFEDIGFSGGFDENHVEDDVSSNFNKRRQPQGLRGAPLSRNNAGLNRPTTPSWADFLSSGFVDEASNGPRPLLLPPDKILPPIDTRGRSSQSHEPRMLSDAHLEPGELASITRFDLDDSFWWVWISSLAGEEPSERKGTFGRCALVETVIAGGKWLVMEEMVKGAASAPEEGAYIAEKKSFWGRTRKGMTRRKSTGKPPTLQNNKKSGYGIPSVTASKASIGPDQHARIQAAAVQLQQKHRQQDLEQEGVRRGRNDVDIMNSTKTNSVMTLQPVIMSEASPAMKWANKYDKDAIREAYLANSTTGRGGPTNGHALREPSNERDLPAVPTEGPAVPSKVVTPPTPLPPAINTSIPQAINEQAEKAVEVELPHDTPVERKPVPETIEISEEQPSQPEVFQSPPSSPESKKHNKLKKKEPGNTGFRKMFGRKNRESKLPETLSTTNPDTTNGGLQPGGAALGRRFSGFIKKSSPVVSPESEAHRASPVPPISEGNITPIASPQKDYERSYATSARDSLSRVNTSDAQEAHHAFSSFDQGPMEDVPAFVPDDHTRQSEESVPPPIQNSEEGQPLEQIQSNTQDRWAQIRKNAAERAAQRQSEEQSRGTYSQKDNDDEGETSGEETIESRVARIKARVAELTGNMEDTGSPSTRSPIRK